MQQNFPPKRPIPPRPVIQKDFDNQEILSKQDEVKEIVKSEKSDKTIREPLSDQSKSIIFGLLGGFALLGGIAVLIVMLIL